MQSPFATTIPPELLLIICQLNALYPLSHPYFCEAQPEPFTDLIPGHLRDTINASQVCSRWRSIIISAPELWKHCIDPHHPRNDWTTLLLGRSGSQGITYMLTEPSSNRDGAALLLAREMVHAERLTDYCFNYYEPFVPNLPQSWPRLRTLCITAQEPDGHVDSDDGSGSEDNGEALFSEGFPGPWTPNLECLHLRNVLMSFPIRLQALHATLIHLRIEQPSWRPSWKLWIETIGSLPHLKKLVLFDAVSPEVTQDADVRGGQPLALQLEQFELNEDISVCVQALTQLDLSNTSRILTLTAEVDRVSFHRLQEVTFRLPPIFDKLLQNPLFSPCGLFLDPCGIRVMGLGVHAGVDVLTLVDDEELQAHIGLVSVGIRSTDQELLRSRWRPQIFDIFQPFFGRVTEINLGHAARYREPPGMIESILVQMTQVLWLQQVGLSAWKILYSKTCPPAEQNRGVRQDMDDPTQRFLPLLRSVNFDIDPTVNAPYPLYEEVIRFCEHRCRRENPQLQFIDDLPCRDLRDEASPGRLISFEQLSNEVEAMGIEVNRREYIEH